MPSTSNPSRFVRSARLLGSGLLSFALLLSTSLASEAGKRRFDVPAGEAVVTLKRAAQQAGLEIVYSADVVKDVQTEAVSGHYTSYEALQRMVANTPLSIFQDPQTKAISVIRRSDAEPPSEPRPPPNREPPRTMKRKSPFAILSAWLGLALTNGYTADSHTTPSGLGSISGRILNPSTGEYVRNAEVRIEGSHHTTTSGDGGFYRLSAVPSGQVSVSVSFTGYATATATIHVSSGSTVTHDFELVSVHDGSNTLKLDAFVVLSAREGDAKAIMEQRNSMNIVNSVASDIFGDNVDGNIGEFLKHLPGVDTFIVAGEIRNIALRGLSAEYTSVTLNGLPLVNSDSAAGDSRAFSFEQASLNSIDAIEVSKTVSADVDANAPAGTINLRTKNAFDRKGRRVILQASATAFSEEFHLKRTHGPDDYKSRKILPGGMLEYSDIFLNNRLGVILNVSHSDVYSSFNEVIMSNSLSAAPSAADPRPGVVLFVRLFDGKRTTEKSAVTLTTDYKATSNFAFGSSFIYNKSDLWYHTRSATFNAGSRAAVQGDLVDITSSDAGSVALAHGAISKYGETLIAQPRFEYKRDNLKIDGIFSAGKTNTWYDPMRFRRSLGNINGPTLTGVKFRAHRTSPSTVDWQITQIGGPDWADGTGYTTPNARMGDGRHANARMLTGQFTATLNTHKVIPVIWKTGVKMNREIRDFHQYGESYLYRYRDGAVGGWAQFPSPTRINSSMFGASEQSISGRPVFHPDVQAITKHFLENPSDFTHVMTATNYYNAFIGSEKHYVEDINAAFIMATAQAGKQLTLRGGLRWEETLGNSREYDVVPPAAVVAAGFPVSAGRATTIPGLQYQYNSRPMLERRSSYDNLFPSGAVKYRFTDNLDIHVGYSKTIRRPTWQNITGIWAPNDTAGTVAVPNPGLLPENSDNISVQMSYYFEPIGIVAASIYENNIKDLILSSRLTAEEYGYTGDEYANYIFVTSANLPQKTKVRGLELEYRQSLSFLPRPWNGLSIRASYTRNTSEVVIPQMTPHLVNAGLNYTWGRFSLNTALNWYDDKPTVTNGTGFTRHRLNLDGGGSYRISRRVSFYFSARNLLNAPYITFQRIGNNPDTVSSYRRWGTTWTFGLRGVF